MHNWSQGHSGQEGAHREQTEKTSREGGHEPEDRGVTEAKGKSD